MEADIHFEYVSRATRLERYNAKKTVAKFMPVSIACVNFFNDGNLAFIIRAAACFGVNEVHVIGSNIEYSELKRMSGSTIDFVKLVQHSNPLDFLNWSRLNNVSLVSAELSYRSQSLKDYRFDFSNNVCIVAGNETTGVPEEILQNSDVVKIDMPGIGFCLNTAQTTNIFLYEASRQFFGSGS
jgi:tRNA G18 (ribose-2'-O)-methylase SpoU